MANNGGRLTKNLVDVKWIADLLGMKTSNIYSLVRKRKMPFLKIGNLLRFDIDDINEWIEARKMKASNDRKVL
jgi:excisionase family DNA binding protein